MKPLFLPAAVLAALILAACSEAPKNPEPKTAAAAPKQETPAGPVTAKTAFFEMYKPARAWAPDFMLLTMTSNDVPSIASEGGKFGAWSAVLVSPSRNEARTFTYAVADSEGIHKGLDVSPAQAWSGATANAAPFQTMDFATDSDTAYQVAYKKAESWLKEHPGKKVAFTLGNASRFPTPVWYILWGTKSSGYSVLVSATTGTEVKAKK